MYVVLKANNHATDDQAYFQVGVLKLFKGETPYYTTASVPDGLENEDNYHNYFNNVVDKAKRWNRIVDEHPKP